MFSKKCIRLLVVLIISFVAIPMVTKAETQLPAVIENTITLTEDVSMDSDYLITDNSEITLDLNGYSFTSTKELKIDVGSKLTIVDNSVGKTGSVSSSIANNGILVLNIDKFTSKITEDYTVNPNIQTILNSEDKELVKSVEKVSYVVDYKDANYENLDLALNNASLVNRDIYTSDSLAVLDDAVANANAVSRDLKINEQSQIDNATRTIETAIEGLVKKPANYTELDGLVENARGLNQDYYTEETVSGLREALTDNDNLSRDLKIDEQNLVDVVSEKVRNAVNALVKKPASYDDLDETIANTENINRDIYTDDSLAVLDDAVAVANAISRDLKIDEQSQIDNAARDIQTAVEELVKKPAVYDELNESLNTAANINRDIYTDDSLAILDDAVAVANALGRDLKIDEQDQVDNAATEIKTAVENLVKKPADYTELNDIVATAEEINQDIYTEETVNGLLEALADNTNLSRDLKIDEQDQVDVVTEKVRAAINALEKKPANYAELDELLATVEGLNRDIYTEESLENLNSILEVVNALDRNLKIDEQDQVDSTVSMLNNAIETLEKKPAIYDGLNEIIHQANDIDRTLYTDESLNVLDGVVEEANNIQRDLKIDEQNQIDTVAANVRTAIEALEKKPASYEQLDEVITIVRDMNRDIYTEESLTQLDEAILAADNLSRDFKIDEQAEVDNVTATIRTALSELVKKDADYTELDQLIETAKSLTDDIYTSESLSTLETPVSKAEAIARDLKIDEQEIIDEAANELRAVINALEKKPADYSQINQIIAATELINKDLYTADSVSALENAVTKAVELSRDLKIDEQDQVDQIVAEINAAVEGLVKKPANYSELEELLDTVKNIDRSQYTEDSLKTLDDLVEEASLINSDLTIDDQNIIDEMKNKISEAVENLIHIGENKIVATPVEEEGLTIAATIDEKTNRIISDSMSEELKQQVNNAIANAEDVTTEIVTKLIDEETADDAVKAEIEAIRRELPASTNVVKFFDLSIFVKGNNISERITETTEDIMFSITIPEELLAQNRVFSIYRIHNGVVSKVESTLNGNVLTFSSHEFSTYALVYTNVSKENEVLVNSEKINNVSTISNPNTGDEIIYFISLLAFAITSLLGSSLAYAKIRK